MFKAGIQYAAGIDFDAVRNSILSQNTEIYVSEAGKILESLGDKDKGTINIKGLVWKVAQEDVLSSDSVKSAVEAGAQYIVAETRGLSTVDKLVAAVDNNIELIRKCGLCLLVENSNLYNGKHYIYGPFSEGKKLCDIVEGLRQHVHYDNIGICADIGVANVLGSNLKTFTKDCMRYLALIHMNDNDGVTDMAQMPFTFTVGRGTRATDIFRVIGILIQYDYNGYIVFNNRGTWEVTPRQLHHSMVRLMEGMTAEWQKEYRFKESIADRDRKLVLFGGGNMFRDYMISFGDKYPPEFIVDNDKNSWGQERLGITVKSPEEILAIPADKRNVWICNMNYDIIGKQLEGMGIEYNCFIDQYYI